MGEILRTPSLDRNFLVFIKKKSVFMLCVNEKRSEELVIFLRKRGREGLYRASYEGKDNLKLEQVFICIFYLYSILNFENYYVRCMFL